MNKIIFITLLFFSQNLLFADNNTTEEKNFLDKFIPLHTKVLNNYHNFLKNIDNLLCANKDLNNTKLEKIIYKNNLYIITSLKHTKDDSLNPYLYVRGNIILPKTNKRFEFTIDKQTESRSINQNLDEAYDNTLEDEKVHLGFKYNLVKDDYLNFYTKLSTRINALDDIYAKVGVVKYLNYRSFMLFLDAQVNKYLLNEELITSTSINFIFPFKEDFILEKNTIFTWKKAADTKTFDYITKLYQTIDSKQSLAYQLSYTAEDNEICHYCPKEYKANVRYRYMFRKWAYAELMPQLKKRKDNDYALEKALTLNFGLIFSTWL